MLWVAHAVCATASVNQFIFVGITQSLAFRTEFPVRALHVSLCPTNAFPYFFRGLQYVVRPQAE